MGAYRTYILVWAALIVLTGITWQASYIDMGAMNVVAVMVIASVKASLVALFFMHLRHESKLVWGFAIFPLIILALMILGTLSDTLYR